MPNRTFHQKAARRIRDRYRISYQTALRWCQENDSYERAHALKEHSPLRSFSECLVEAVVVRYGLEKPEGNGG